MEAFYPDFTPPEGPRLPEPSDGPVMRTAKSLRARANMKLRLLGMPTTTAEGAPERETVQLLREMVLEGDPDLPSLLIADEEPGAEQPEALDRLLNKPTTMLAAGVLAIGGTLGVGALAIYTGRSLYGAAVDDPPVISHEVGGYIMAPATPPTEPQGITEYTLPPTR